MLSSQLGSDAHTNTPPPARTATDKATSDLVTLLAPFTKQPIMLREQALLALLLDRPGALTTIQRLMAEDAAQFPTVIALLGDGLPRLLRHPVLRRIWEAMVQQGQAEENLDSMFRPYLAQLRRIASPRDLSDAATAASAADRYRSLRLDQVYQVQAWLGYLLGEVVHESEEEVAVLAQIDANCRYLALLLTPDLNDRRIDVDMGMSARARVFVNGGLAHQDALEHPVDQ